MPFIGAGRRRRKEEEGIERKKLREEEGCNKKMVTTNAASFARHFLTVRSGLKEICSCSQCGHIYLRVLLSPLFAFINLFPSPALLSPPPPCQGEKIFVFVFLLLLLRVSLLHMEKEKKMRWCGVHMGSLLLPPSCGGRNSSLWLFGWLVLAAAVRRWWKVNWKISQFFFHSPPLKLAIVQNNSLN